MNQAANLAVTLVFLGFWTTAFVIFYHLVRFGIGVFPKRLATAFVAGSLALFTLCLVSYLKLDLGALSAIRI